VLGKYVSCPGASNKVFGMLGLVFGRLAVSCFVRFQTLCIITSSVASSDSHAAKRRSAIDVKGAQDEEWSMPEMQFLEHLQ
jgi:zona occludens toxin (predicted ATPase)